MTVFELVETLEWYGVSLLWRPHASLRSASCVSESKRNRRRDVDVAHLRRENGLFSDLGRGSVSSRLQDGHRAEDHLRIGPVRVAEVCSGDDVLPKAGACGSTVPGRGSVAFALQALYGQLSPIGVSRYLKSHITITPGVGEELRCPCTPGPREVVLRSWGAHRGGQQA